MHALTLSLSPLDGCLTLALAVLGVARPEGGPGMGGVVGGACCCWFAAVLPVERLVNKLPGVGGVCRRGDGVEGLRLVKDGNSYNRQEKK